MTRWQLIVGKERALTVLAAMYPYLTLKHDQAALAIRLLGLGQVTGGPQYRAGLAVDVVREALRALKDSSARRQVKRRQGQRVVKNRVRVATRRLDALGAPSAEDTVQLLHTGRRTQTVSKTRTHIGGLSLTGGVVHLHGRPARFGSVKNALMVPLVGTDGPVSHEVLLKAGWPDGRQVSAECRRQHVRQLNEKLRPLSLVLVNIRGYGYELVPIGATTRRQVGDAA
ncbi:hypothetical protein [Geodermatophilus sp. URMC 62]|uniref:hypothetical protein n=1 Tax=Geodermatophilus sp. URMC 62 TaxID=3423414 RepID=UPI00406D2277